MTSLPFQIGVLGPIGFLEDGQFSALRGQQGAVLATVAAHYPRSVQQSTVIDVLWPVRAPSSAKGSLGVALHRLRARLPEPEMIVTEGSSYRLAVDSELLDLAAFRSRLNGERSQDAALRIEVLTEAIGLWRGRPFQPIGDDSPFASTSAELLEMKRNAEEQLVDALLDAGRTTEAANRASVLVDAEPYRERRWELLMLSLYRSSQQAEALRAAQRAREVLADDLGIEPGPALRQLEQDILRQDSSLLQGSMEDGSPIESLVDGGGVPTTVVPVFRGPFVGRAEQLPLLADAIDSYPVVELVGPPGIGKSRLAARYGATIGSDRRTLWIDVGGLSNVEVIEHIGAITNLGPSGVSIDEILAELAREPTLVVFDGATPQLLPIVQQLRDAEDVLRTLVVGRETLGDSGALEIVLDALDEDEAVAILRSVSGVSDSEATRAIREIGMIPQHVHLFGAQLGSASLDELLADWREPQGHGDDSLTAALDWSVGRLTDDQRSLYEELSVFAGWVSAADIGGVVGRGTAVVRGQLRALVAVGLVRTRRHSDRSGRVGYRLDLSMRTHARGLLEARQGLVDAEERHTNYFYDLALLCGREAEGPDEKGAVDHLGHVSPELQRTMERLLFGGEVARAIEYVLALREYSFFRLDYSMFEWPKLVLEHPEAVGHDRYPELLAVAGQRAWAIDRISAAQDWADESVRAATDREVPVSLTALRTRVTLAATSGDGAGVIDAMSEFEAAAVERGTERDVADALVNRSVAMAFLGDRESALGAAHESLERAVRSENPSSIAWAKYAIGTAELLGNPDAAIMQFRESLRLARTVDNKWVMSASLGGLATGARRSQRASQAVQPLAALLETWIAMRKERFFARVLNEAALVLIDLDHNDDARTMLGWASSYSADPLIIPDDRSRLNKARSELTPPLLSEVFDIAEHARIARRLLVEASKQ